MILSSSPLIAQADSNLESIQWVKSLNQPKNKEWTVTFNKKIDSTSVNADSVYVTDPDGKETGVQPTVDSTGKAILIPAPSDGYKAGVMYTLHVTTEVKESQGTNLKSSVSKQFTIRDHSQDDSSIIEPYKTSFEIVNTSSTGEHIRLSFDADTISYIGNSVLETFSLKTNHVYIPAKGTAIVSFDKEVSSPLADTVTGITYHKTDEPAFWRVNLTADSAAAFTKISDGRGYIQIAGGSYFFNESDEPSYLGFFEESPYGHNNIDLNKNTTRSFQPKSGAKINIYATYRSFSFEELSTPFANEYVVKPTKTAVLTTDKMQSSILVDKESTFEYVDYSSYGRIELGMSKPQNHFKSIFLTNDSQYVMTNKGGKKYFVASLAGTFSIQDREEPALQTEILRPQTSKIITNNSLFQTRINISGQGALDYATYNKNGSSRDFDQRTFRKDTPGFLTFENSQKIVLTNTGAEPLQLSYPSMQHRSEDTALQALRKESIEPGATSIWKNTFPVDSSIRVIGNGYIEFAQYNSIGDIQTFGMGEIIQKSLFGMPLWPNNASVITNSGTTPLQLIGPENIFTVHKSNERALQSEIVDSGKTLAIQPAQSSASRALVIAEGSYDFAEYRDNYVGEFNKKVFPPSFKSEEMFHLWGELLITNKGEKSLTVYVPNKLTNLTFTDESALLEKTLNPGERVMWINTSDSSVNMVLSGNGPYHYISKDYEATIISENRRTLTPAWTNHEFLPWNGSLEITNEGNESITIYGPARFLTISN